MKNVAAITLAIIAAIVVFTSIVRKKNRHGRKSEFAMSHDGDPDLPW